VRKLTIETSLTDWLNFSRLTQFLLHLNFNRNTEIQMKKGTGKNITVGPNEEKQMKTAVDKQILSNPRGNRCIISIHFNRFQLSVQTLRLFGSPTTRG
jgi:hypothetical protein